MKNRVIQFRVDPEQEEQLKLRAHSAGMTVSDYIRYLVDLDINTPELLDELLKSAEGLQTLAKKLSSKSK
jgi:antitoxin component of RelBE/YafQ-DinJ toxin-antitoxin module